MRKELLVWDSQQLKVYIMIYVLIKERPPFFWRFCIKEICKSLPFSNLSVQLHIDRPGGTENII